MKFIELTDSKGHSHYVNAIHIVRISASSNKETYIFTVNDKSSIVCNMNIKDVLKLIEK